MKWWEPRHHLKYIVGAPPSGFNIQSWASLEKSAQVDLCVSFYFVRILGELWLLVMEELQSMVDARKMVRENELWLVSVKYTLIEALHVALATLEYKKCLYKCGVC